MFRRSWRTFSNPQRLRDAVARRLSPVAFSRPLGPCPDDPQRFSSLVPDRYASNLEKYIERGGTHCSETLSKFLLDNDRNEGDLSRYYFLKLATDQLLKENITGNVAELGVWRGNTAAVLVEFGRRIDSIIYLIDTFEGFDKADLAGVDADKRMEFADTTVDRVADFLGSDNINFLKGYFPDTCNQIPSDARFALVHIDCDLYKPFKAGLEFFYPRLVTGGFLIMHDYTSLWWDGVERAVDKFFADKKETVIPIPDRAGTAVIRKI